MIEALLYYETSQPCPGMPLLQTLSRETQCTPKYLLEGRLRAKERHCIFKYTLAGEGMFRLGKAEHRVPTGSGFLCEICNPATAYYYPPDRTQPWSFVYAAFAGEAATKLVRGLLAKHGPVYSLPLEHRAVEAMISPLQEKPLRSQPASQDNPACQGVAAPYAGFPTQEISAAAGARQVYDLLLALAESKGAAEEHGNELVHEAKQMVRGRLDSISVKLLARCLGVSREHLSRVFRAQTGMPPHVYIMRQRLFQACRLLKETSLRQKEVASQLGFASAAEFTRAFRRHLHMPPTQFRLSGSLPQAGFF